MKLCRHVCFKYISRKKSKGTHSAVGKEWDHLSRQNSFCSLMNILKGNFLLFSAGKVEGAAQA